MNSVKIIFLKKLNFVDKNNYNYFRLDMNGNVNTTEKFGFNSEDENF